MTVKQSNRQIGSGVVNGDSEPGIPRKNGKVPKKRAHRKAVKPESDVHFEQQTEESPWREHYRKIHGAIELHEIGRRSHHKDATAYPENVLPCPTRAYHDMVQHEPVKKQLARKIIQGHRIVQKMYGKRIPLDEVWDEVQNLLEEIREAQYFGG